MWSILAFAALALLSVTGCSSGDPGAVAVGSWTASLPDGASIPIVLPAHLDAQLPRAASTYTLRTEVPIPPGWRGQPLTISMLAFHARCVLVWGATELHDDATSFLEPQHSSGPHLWHVPASLTAAERVPVEMRVDYDWQPAAWIDAAPMLGVEEQGPPRFRFVRTFNAVTTPLSLASVLLLVVTYGAVWLVDRKRTAHGWFALQALGAIPLLVFFADLGQWLLGARAGYPVTSLLHGAPFVVALYFVHAYFRLPSPSRLWWLCAVAPLPLNALHWDAFHTSYSTGVSLASAGVVALGLFRCLVPLARRAHPPMNARAFLACWCLAWVSSFPVDAELGGLGAPLGGLATLSLGLFLFGVIQFVALAREHLASLQVAEARVLDLEGQRRELEGLTDELRHQVAARSRDLRDALARSESTVSPQLLREGETFDNRYRVVRQLGAGGMGAVFEVERQSDAKRLALKVVTGVVTGSAAARFAREAEIGARMKHPNLVSIVDVGISRSTTPFLVMEHVVGGSLEGRRHTFGDVGWGLPVLRQIADALGALHVAGIVHRDLKPGNVLLTASDGGSVEAKVADFGISRFDEPAGATDALAATMEGASPAHRLTGTGALLGTPQYMAPEGARGAAAVGPASDMFSFGVLAYEVLTGRGPFTMPPVFHALAGQPPPAPAPLGETTAALGDELSRLLLECLASDPRARPDAQRMSDALRSRAAQGR